MSFFFTLACVAVASPVHISILLLVNTHLLGLLITNVKAISGIHRWCHRWIYFFYLKFRMHKSFVGFCAQHVTAFQLKSLNVKQFIFRNTHSALVKPISVKPGLLAGSKHSNKNTGSNSMAHVSRGSVWSTLQLYNLWPTERGELPTDVSKEFICIWLGGSNLDTNSHIFCMWWDVWRVQ